MDANDPLARRSRGVITLVTRMAGGGDGNGGEMSGMGPFARWLDWSQGSIVHDGSYLEFMQSCAIFSKRTGGPAR